MTIQFTNWVVGPNPTEINSVLPIITFVSPPTPIEGARVGTRTVIIQWTSNKPECLYKIKWGSAWGTEWQNITSYTINDISNGDYAFSVKGKDKYGNESVPITVNFTIYRELPIPTPIAPAMNAILPSTATSFVCSVPPGEIGQSYHFEFQIGTDPLMTQLVDNVSWFSSVNGYSGFSYVAPVAQNQGGTISFTKSLSPRKNYWWRCRIRLAGTDQVGAASETLPFTVGVLATKLLLTAAPLNVRADGKSTTTLTAKAVNRLDVVDTEWVGGINFGILSGVANFIGTPDLVPLSSGMAAINVYSNTLNNVTFVARTNYLIEANAVVNFTANRLPNAPEWLTTPINPSEVFVPTASLSFTIPTDPDNDRLHMKLELDTKETFDTPDFFIAESRFSLVGWEYYDGTNWKAYPTDGVPQGLAGGIIRYTTTQPLLDGKTYYCRVSAWDGVEK